MSESNDTPPDAGRPAHDHDQMEAKLTDYLDGALSADERREVDAHVKSCAECRDSMAALQSPVTALSGLSGLKAEAPEHFEREVEETIRRRSQGRFFGRRTFGDRVPLEILAVLALALGLLLYLLLRSSETGSLVPPNSSSTPTVPGATSDVIPKP